MFSIYFFIEENFIILGAPFFFWVDCCGVNWCRLVSTFPRKRKEEIHHQLVPPPSNFFLLPFFILFLHHSLSYLGGKRCSIRIRNPHANPHTNGICKEIDIGTRERSIQRMSKLFSFILLDCNLFLFYLYRRQLKLFSGKKDDDKGERTWARGRPRASTCNWKSTFSATGKEKDFSQESAVVQRWYLCWMNE